jgi:hypothetical protein
MPPTVTKNTSLTIALAKVGLKTCFLQHHEVFLRNYWLLTLTNELWLDNCKELYGLTYNLWKQ